MVSIRDYGMLSNPKRTRAVAPSHEGLPDGKHLRAEEGRKGIDRDDRARNSTLRRRGKKYGEKRAEAFGPQAEGCRRLPCFRCATVGASVPHHEPPVADGGTDEDTIPLCDITILGVDGCHQIRHNRGPISFWSSLGCSPDEAKDHVRLQLGIRPAEVDRG